MTDHGMTGCGDDVCITCGDRATEVVVVAVDGIEAWCVDADGARQVVAVDLVAPVETGDRVLVHAGVALARLDGSRA